MAWDISFIALIVGLALIVFPEPATTATGLLIVTASLGLSAIDEENGD